MNKSQRQKKLRSLQREFRDMARRHFGICVRYWLCNRHATEARSMRRVLSRAEGALRRGATLSRTLAVMRIGLCAIDDSDGICDMLTIIARISTDLAAHEREKQKWQWRFHAAQNLIGRELGDAMQWDSEG